MKSKLLVTWPVAVAVGATIAGAAMAQGPGPMRGERGWGMGDGMGWRMWWGGPGPWGVAPTGCSIASRDASPSEAIQQCLRLLISRNDGFHALVVMLCGGADRIG